MTSVNATIAAPRLLLVAGGGVKQIAEVLAKFGLSRPLVVSDPFMVSSGLIRRCLTTRSPMPSPRHGRRPPPGGRRDAPS